MPVSSVFTRVLVATAAALGVSAGVLANSGTALAAAATPGGLTQISSAGHVVRTIPVGGNPTAVAAGGGVVWATVLHHHGIWMINPRTGATRHIPNVSASEPLSLAATSTAAYVLDGVMVRIVDRTRASRVGTVSVAGIPGEPTLVAAGPGGVWGINSDTAYRLRRSGGSMTTPKRFRLHVPARENDEQVRDQLTAMAVGRTAVWLIGDVGDRRLWRIDPRRPRITRTVQLPFAPVAVAVGFGRVWVTGQISNRVYELDPATGKIVKSIAVGREPIGVAAGAGAVWVANATDGSVSKINPGTGTVTATIPVTGTPTHLAVAAGSVWVTSRARPADASGGGIRIGVVVDCAGFSFQLQQTIAGAELPLIQRGATLRGKQPSGGLNGATVAGKPVTLLTACKTFGDRSTVISALSKLVEIEGADIVIGPSQNRDAIAVREYARSHPNTTFIAAGGEQATTLKHTVPNLYRFLPDPVQLFAGLGAYARHTLGWKTAATVSNSDESSWPSVAGFDTEFCSLGGHIPNVDRVWVDRDDDQGRHLPTGVDGVFLQGGGFGPFGGSGSFVPKWGKLHPPVGRHLVVGWSVLWPVPQLVGVVGASTDPYKSTPAWQHYLDAFAKAFPGAGRLRTRQPVVLRLDGAAAGSPGTGSR